MVVVTVARRPLPNGSTVASNSLEHGCGGLAIDETRIGHLAEGDDGLRVRNNKVTIGDGSILAGGKAVGTSSSPGGRWPANLVLGHLGGCRETGTREVRSSAAGNRNKALGIMNDDSWQPSPTTDNRAWLSKDGTETVPVWECEPGCPVRGLDQQAGHLVSGKPTGMKQGTREDSFGDLNARFAGVPVTGYGDEGGASRFFKQVKQDW